MRFRIPWGPVAVITSAVLMPFHTGGCGQTSCITFGQAAYEKNGNQCPSAEQALKRFGAGSCFGNGEITAVQGEGTFDGEFCCYPVVGNSNNGFDTPVCDVGGSTGFGGAGGFDTTSVGGAGGVFTSSVGVGGEGGAIGVGGGVFTSSVGVGGNSSFDGGSGCLSCAEAMANGVTTSLCGFASPLYAGLQHCGCDNSCPNECAASLCADQPVDSACATCLSNNCIDPLTACNTN